jgi:hypothetical protein
MMLKRIRDWIATSRRTSLARTFSFLGWTGFWLQIVFGSMPVILMVYYYVFSSSPSLSRSGLPLVEVLAVVNLLMLLFTIFWSYRYTRLGKQLRDSEKGPTESSVNRAVWTGVTASTVSMLFSMIVMLLEAANLLYRFLKAPQGGVPVIQVSGAEEVYWVSAGDMVSLIALILMLFAELIVLAFSLWLLFRTSVASPEVPQAASK